MAAIASFFLFFVFMQFSLNFGHESHQPLSMISYQKSKVQLDASASVAAFPIILGIGGENENVDTVHVTFNRPAATVTQNGGDWIGVFSPAELSSMICSNDTENPMLCTAPIKFQYANFSQTNYSSTGQGYLKFRLINQRNNFAFALFTGGFINPILVAISNIVGFAKPKAPAYPRLAMGKSSDEMTVTWTSGYSEEEAIPFVAWHPAGEPENELISYAETLTFTRNDMCGQPANTVGWRDPGFIHTSYLKGLWPSSNYNYKIGHTLKDGNTILSSSNFFTSTPFPGQDSLQRVIIFGDMGKGQRDLSNMYSNNQYGSLNTTDCLNADLGNYDAVFHIGDISYADGYLSEWDQFTEQIQNVASRVPYMTGSGNHDRDWPNTGTMYNSWSDSGGECGVPNQSYFNMPANNRSNFWYSADFGMFHFCVADSENDWKKGSEQYKFLEECLASIDRQKQPWLVFISHRVLGYSSAFYYAKYYNFSETGGRETYEELWNKYKVDIAFYGHAHQYERTCPVNEGVCVSKETKNYSGAFNATIHVVVGGGGYELTEFAPEQPAWSITRDKDYGFVKLTAYNHSSLLVEYKKSSTGLVYDQFSINRDDGPDF